MQAAVDAADAPEDTIKVAAGAYTDVHARSGVTQVVYLSKTLTLQGGYTLTNWLVPDPIHQPTLLNAQGRGRVLYITGDISPVIAGLQISGGDARGLGGVIIDEWGNQLDVGGGIYLNATMTTLRDAAVLSNTALWGGGIYVEHARVYFDRTTWTFNRAVKGGGIYLFESGDASLTASVFKANVATFGGGVYDHAGHVTLAGDSFSLNVADADGGGAYFLNSHGVLTGDTWIGNMAKRGGGMFIIECDDIVVMNTIIARNRVDLLGGGVYQETSNLQFVHTTIASNQGGDGSGLYVTGMTDWWGDPYTSTARLTHTIIADQAVGVSVSDTATMTLETTLWGQGDWANTRDWQGPGQIVTGTHNIWGDPDFTCAHVGCLLPYRIGPNSAAVDAGTQLLAASDIDGEPRPAGAATDLGADEHSVASMMPARVKDRFVFAFYHPWYYYLNIWNEPKFLDHPLFLHNSNDPKTIRQHLIWSAGAGLDGLLVSWAGPTHPTNAIFAQTLDAMAGTDLCATAYFEISWYDHFDSITTTLNDLRYVLNTYGDHPSLLRQDGRPVLLLYGVDTLPRATYPTTYAAWQFIVETLHAEGYNPFLLGDTFILDPAYLTVFDGLFTYFPSAPTSAYQLLSRQARQSQRLWMLSFYPGYDNRLIRDPYIYIPRNQGQTYAATFASAMSTTPDWLSVTSFNEWYENTHIEPGQMYGYDYLLYTADYAARFHRWRAYATVYADPAYVGPSDGSPARPFRTLQDALFSAADGATVYLAGGDYTGPFTLTRSITLTGGYGPGWTLTNSVSPTMLRGDGAGSVVRIVGEASFYTPTVILDRIMLTGGDAPAGGGVYIQAADVTLRRVIVADNHAQTWGGGVAVQAGALRLDAARLLRNTANVGGGFYAGPGTQVWLVNTLIAENAATFAGGGGYLHPSAVLSLMYSTVTANTAADVGGLYAWLWSSQSVNMHNSIVWGNTERNLQCNVGCSVRYSDIEGGWPGMGNLDVAPRFTDAAYHLAPDSPLVDVGGIVPPLPLTDFEGDSRLLGEGLDIGADEVNPVLLSSVSVTPQVVAPGSVLTYTVRLSNLGGRQTSFVITDTLSALTRYIPGSAQWGRGAVLTSPVSGTAMLPERLVWQGMIYSDEVLTLRFAATVLSATLELCETITNEAVFRTDRAAFARQAVAHRGPLERSVLAIETAPGGGQPLVVTQTLTPGAVLPLYAAVYNGCGHYLGPLSVTWTTSGTLEAQTGVGARFDFSSTLVDRVGRVTAAADGLHAHTGQLRVIAPPELTLTPAQLAETQPQQTVGVYPLTLTNGNALSLTYVFTSAFVEPFEVTYTWDASFFANAVIVGKQSPLAHPEWSYYFAPEQIAPRLVGAQVTVTDLDMQVYGVNLGSWVNWDWEVFLSDGDIPLPEGQFLATRSNPFDSYARTTPMWFAVSIGERQTIESYHYSVSHDFETGATRVTPFYTGDLRSRSLPLAIQDGLHAQALLWTGDSRVAQHFNGLRLTVRGVATYTTLSTAWLSVLPESGLIPPRSSEIVQVRADSHDLHLGVHTGMLWLLTNDPAHAITPIPFHLTVGVTRFHLPFILREASASRVFLATQPSD